MTTTMNTVILCRIDSIDSIDGISHRIIPPKNQSCANSSKDHMFISHA